MNDQAKSANTSKSFTEIAIALEVLNKSNLSSQIPTYLSLYMDRKVSEESSKQNVLMAQNVT